MRLCFLLLCTLIMGSCSPTTPEAISLDNIKIARDQWGVPHIIAPTDNEVAYGFAWAQCEDDFITLQEQMLAVQGNYGKVKGKEGIIADFGIQFMGLREAVEANYENAFSPEFKAYLESYVDGINNYAALHPEEVLLKKMFPLKTHDIILGYLLGTVELSQAGKHLQRIMNGQIIKEVKSNFPKGSNAIAISRKKTTDNKTYLAINSHQPLEGWYSWYEAHLISDEGLNILGGTFPGGITIFHGVNENLGWAHTVNHVDLSDVFKLEMHPDKKLTYKFDDEWLELEEVTYKAKMKLLGPLMFPVKRKIYRSKYGPSFETDDGFFAWRFVVTQDIRSAEQWFKMNKASSFEEFKAALDMQAIPSTNIVYADREDNIYFLSNGNVPIRNEQYNWREVVPGNSAQTLWEDFYPLDSLPHILNPQSGFVFNTNNTPFSASGDEDNVVETDLNKTMTYQHTDMENGRSRRFLELIAQYDSLSYEDFKRIKFDQNYPGKIQSREMMNVELLLSLDPAKHADIADAIKALNNWNRSFAPDNTGAPFYIYSLKLLLEKLRAEDRTCWRCEITEEDVLTAIRGAKSHFMEKYQKLALPLGDFQRHSRGSVNLPIGGGPDVLGAIYSQEQEDGTFRAMAGESYIELVRFSDEGVEIESVHAYGSSAEPDSPHYTDQMELFVNQKLKKMTLDKETVLKEAKKVYSPKKVAN